jgi:AcrR family transcriptional regulator
MPFTSSIAPASPDRILDSAETLFAQRGYYGVSLRDITADSGTSLNLVRYHFGSKDDLFRAVTARRVDAMNEALLQSLAAAQARGTPMRPSHIISAYTTAFSQLNSQRTSWHNYLKLLIHSDSLVDRPELISHLRESYQPVFDRYVAAFEAADMSHENACWSVYFMQTSVAQLAADVYSCAQLSRGVCDPMAKGGLEKRLEAFIASGLTGFITKRVR